MPCETIKLSDGTHAILCARGRTRHCTYCDRTATRLCDWELPNDKTCDLPICPGCSTRVSDGKGPDKDYCSMHVPEKK